MADEIDPLAVRMGLILDYPRNTAGSEAWVEKFTGTSRIVAEELAAAGAAADDDLITIPDGRKLLAVEYLALMTFAYANQMTEWTLWRRVKRGRSGRVAAVGEFYWRRLTDITALASCTKIKALYFTGNDIADISALASCGELRSLWLGTNRITDISALAGCGKLDTLSLENNEITDISALTGCARLTTLSLQGNRAHRNLRPRELREARLAVPWREPNHRHLRARTLHATSLRISSRQPPRQGEQGGDRETTRSTSNG